MHTRNLSFQPEKTLFVLLTAVLGACYFFRFQVYSGWDLMIGDEADGLLILALIEHWYRVFTGLDPWLDLNWFYPTTGTLGYSDAFFMYGLIHSIFRLLGLDTFTALQVTLVCLYLVGFAGTFYLLRQKLNFPIYLAAIGALIFCSGHWIYKASTNSHLQLLSTWLIPWLFLCFWSWFEGLLTKDARKAGVWGVATAICLTIFLYTAFYVSWFACIFVCIFIALTLIIWCFRDGFLATGSLVWDLLKFNKVNLIITAGVFFVLILPFLITYLPALTMSGGQPYHAIKAGLPRPVDFINLGASNLAWGWLESALQLQKPSYSHEVQYGYPPIMLMIFIVGFFLIIKRLYNKQTVSHIEVVLLVAGLSVITIGLLMVKINDVSAWKLVHQFIPGASAVRAVFRFQLILSFPVMVMGLWVLHQLIQSSLSCKRKPVLACLLLLVLPLELVNLAVNARVEKSEIRLLIAQAPQPPEDIRSFYILPSSVSSLNIFKANTLAMHLAQALNIPTLNGYSGLFPPGWGLLDVHAPDFFNSLDSWLNQNDLNQGIYSFDRNAKVWVPHGMEQRLIPQTNHPFPQLPAHIRLSHGWSGMEKWGVWTSSHTAQVEVNVDALAVGAKVLQFRMHAFTNDAVPAQRIYVFTNGEYTTQAMIDKKDPMINLAIPVKASKDNTMKIEFFMPDAHSPNSIDPRNGDTRKLGLGFHSLSVFR